MRALPICQVAYDMTLEQTPTEMNAKLSGSFNGTLRLDILEVPDVVVTASVSGAQALDHYLRMASWGTTCTPSAMAHLAKYAGGEGLHSC